MNRIFDRNVGLCLLLSAVFMHAETQFDTAGTRPGSCGLTRITRDLIRKAAGPERKPMRAAALAPPPF